MDHQLVRADSTADGVGRPSGAEQRTCRPERRLAGLAVQVLTALGEAADVAAVSSRPALIRPRIARVVDLCCSLLLCTARQARRLGG
jgi:hypothetical protein